LDTDHVGFPLGTAAHAQQLAPTRASGRAPAVRPDQGQMVTDTRTSNYNGEMNSTWLSQLEMDAATPKIRRN